jgi:hypothetical protein
MNLLAQSNYNSTLHIGADNSIFPTIDWPPTIRCVADQWHTRSAEERAKGLSMPRKWFWRLSAGVSF